MERSDHSPRPRILRVISRMSIGGVQRGLLATLARASRDEFDYHVLCYKKAGGWADRLAELNVPMHVQRTIPVWHPFKLMMLARAIRRIAPDLVHIQMAPTVIPAATAARIAGVKRIVIQHHNDYALHWQSLGPLLRKWEFKLTREADAVMAVSEAVARCTEEHVGLAPGSVRVIPNGLELDRFSNAEPRDPRPEWGIAPGTPLVVHVARYLPTKRIEDFIDAGARILARWPDGRPRPVFAVIGGSDSRCEKVYRETIERLGVGSGVLLVGNRDDVPQILPTVQVAALASEMEGFGQVILEYIAAGVPVASTDLPCIAEMVRGGRDVLFSPPRRPDLLADNIEKLLLDRDLAKRLVENGREQLKKYDWSAAVKGYEELYREILKQDQSNPF
ncbi:glycosyltransferase [bacterium]|nr:glycosyltransferase [bacterium]